jgi:hypothetical protein
VILLGDGEWDGLLRWLRERPLSERRVDGADLELLHLVGRPADVCPIVDAAQARLRASGRRPSYIHDESAGSGEDGAER